MASVRQACERNHHPALMIHSPTMPQYNPLSCLRPSPVIDTVNTLRKHAPAVQHLTTRSLQHWDCKHIYAAVSNHICPNWLHKIPIPGLDASPKSHHASYSDHWECVNVRQLTMMVLKIKLSLPATVHDGFLCPEDARLLLQSPKNK